ncbi:hypothetical protein GCM10007338_19050 [Corynebacterium pelargi]|nr:hypothetical protein GCM10007338_19050 [Corynebacterium pelargi]
MCLRAKKVMVGQKFKASWQFVSTWRKATNAQFKRPAARLGVVQALSLDTSRGAQVTCVAMRLDPRRSPSTLTLTILKGSFINVARVVVNVMPKAEILDPQGQAVVRALGRLGVEGVADVRQGKRFEIEVDDAVTRADIEKMAETLLANTVIENFDVIFEAAE